MDRYNLEDFLRCSSHLPAEVIEELADRAGVGLFNLNLATGDISLNRNITLLTGYEPGDLPHSANTKEILTFEDDRQRVNQSMASIISGEKKEYSIEYRMRRRDGSLVSIAETAIACGWDEEGNVIRIAGLARDLSRLRWAEEKARNMEKENKYLALGASSGELAEQNRLLRATNVAANMIIGGFHQDYETVLRQALQILGESVQAQRVCIWRNKDIDGEFSSFLRICWQEGDNSLDENDVTFYYSDLCPEWSELIKDEKGMAKLISAVKKRMQDVAIIYNAASIMLIPLFIQGEFWGLISFDSPDESRVFTAYEEDIMGSGALVIASSVSRNETFRSLNAAREAAMASTKAKGEFLSRMSHEIRTPMNAIIGMTTIARKTDDVEKIRYCLDKVDASSRQLLGIINDVLDMSKIEADKFEISLSEFDFEKMMQNVFNVVQVKLDEKHQDFHFNFNRVFGRKVISDELRLSQVLINLLSNAVKFTPDFGQISLIVDESPVNEHRSKLHIEVVDSGIGIEEDKKDKLFMSFEQADGSITRQYGGTGLGLAICKKIVNLMGGDIWVESTPGEGSSFIFEIEVNWGETLSISDKRKAIPPKMHILVVDDNDDVLEYFKNILGGFSLHCDTASNGMAAIEMVKKSIEDSKPYDMIFIDWNMPGLNGGATAEEIQELMGGNGIVVMISVADWSDIEAEAKSHGVSNFLAKPVLPSVLYNTIVKLTDKSLITEKYEAEEAVYDWSDKTILMAEDVEINREIVLSILEETGVTVDCAEDGAKAVQMFSAFPEKYDLILMDMQMPNMDGIEATKRIRALDDGWGEKVPIIAMTANAFKEDEEICIEAGMDCHLSKPLDVNELFMVIETYLKRQHAEIGCPKDN